VRMGRTCTGSTPMVLVDMRTPLSVTHSLTTTHPWGLWVVMVEIKIW
jgi:hypothetical protein